jgi:transposase-like protein
MKLANLLRETLDGEAEDVWENERTPTAVRRFGARLQSMGLSVRETEAVLGWLGVQRSHGAVWRWNHRLADSDDPPTAQPRRVAVDETAVQIHGEWHWVYAAIDVDTTLLLDIELFSRRGADPAAAFLHRLTEKHDLSETEFFVDGYGYLTALSRLGLSGQLDYSDRTHIEKWFHTLKQRTDRFHTSWVGSRPAVREWLQQFRRYYNRFRPHQSLDDQPPATLI